MKYSLNLEVDEIWTDSHGGLGVGVIIGGTEAGGLHSFLIVRRSPNTEGVTSRVFG